MDKVYILAQTMYKNPMLRGIAAGGAGELQMELEWHYLSNTAAGLEYLCN